MNYEIESLKKRVIDMVGGGDVALLFNEIRKDIANKIIDTPVNQTETRENLYFQANGLKLLEEKFQEYLNDINRIEE